MKNYRFIPALLGVLLCWTVQSCSDDDKAPGIERTTTDEIYYANQFAKDVLSDVYLWVDDISADLEKLEPNTNEDPISTVSEIRYKENGQDVDKWTLLTNDLESMIGGTQGVETTFGYNLALGEFSDTGNYFFVVSYVYAGSPAAEAGLKRGDLIVQLDGQDITEANYLNALYNSSITLTMGVMTDEGIGIGNNISLTAKKMYENPILCTKVFDTGSKKIGYLAYSGFDLASGQQLAQIGKEFKAQGVTELILDLRYNGGGYVITENLLASILAPADAVNSKALYQTEIWNKKYTDYWAATGQSTETHFATEFQTYNANNQAITVSTKDSNIGLTKIYAIMTGSSASASEAVVVGLLPYMDIEIIGQQTHGKYCTGQMLGPDDVYEKTPFAIRDWGIYVMINRYADKNGENPCMPDGLTPDVPVKDNVMDGYQLGDEQESMLSVALQRAGYPVSKAAESGVRTRASQFDLRPIITSPLNGKRIETRPIQLIKQP